MGSLVTTNAGANALAAYGGVNPFLEAARGVEDGAYLKFNGNKGDITFGSDDEELPEGSRIIVDMASLALGWICWDDSAVKEELFVPVVDGKAPLEHELTDHGPYNDPDDGWREAASFSAVIASYGDDDQDEAVGTKLLFKTSTGGPVRSTKKLAGQYGRLFMQHMGELPIVELTTDSYMPKNKKHGKKFSLIFKIVGWIAETAVEAMVGGAGDDERDYEPEPEPAPVTKRRAVAAPVVEEEEEEAPAPAPRRRAAAAAPVVEEEEEAPAPAPRRRAAAAPVVEEEEEEAPAPAPRRRAAAAAPVVEEEEAPAPAPRRRAAAAPVVEEEEEEAAPAPAPRRRAAAAAPVAEEEEEEAAPAPAPRRRAAAAAPAEEDEGDVAPTPRGRSPGRAAPPANARVRKFD
jgi:hypothetical protein